MGKHVQCKLKGLVDEWLELFFEKYQNYLDEYVRDRNAVAMVTRCRHPINIYAQARIHFVTKQQLFASSF